MMTVSNGSRRDSSCAQWPSKMPQNRRNSKEDFDAINPSFPPPSRINTSQNASSKETEKRNKKGKKWSLGGLFRRRKSKDSDTDTSSPTEEEEKKGFLERRRSARKKRNRGSKDVTGSFEHVVVNRNSDVNNGQIEKVVVKDGLERLSVRSSHESLNKKQDSGQFHGSSASLEGSGSMRRSGRMKIKARVEANRDRLRADSSSDEGGSSRSRHSVSSTQQFRSDENLGSKDGSLSRRSRAARTERYIKRLSRDEEGIKSLEVEIPKVSRSDERLSSKNSDVRIASGNRWTAKVVYYESSDYEQKYTAKTRSATPSPIQSPKARPKNLLHQTTSAPPGNIYTTFPPSHSRDGVIGSHQELRSHSYQGSGAFHRVTPKSASMQKVNESNVLPKLPKSKSDVSQRPFLQNSLQKQNWDQKFPGTKSASFDSSINVVNQPFAHSHPADSNILVVQFPISRPKEIIDSNKNYQSRLAKHNPPPPPPRDPQRRLLNSNGFQQESTQRPMSYAFESRTHQPKVPLTDYTKNNTQLPNFVKTTHPLPISKHHRSNSDQQLPSQINYLPKQSPPTQRRKTNLYSEPTQPPINKELLEQSLHDQTKVPQHYQYYTDQQPRSRKPIHIACNTQSNDQPYLSDSQVMVKPPYQQVARNRPPAVQNASDFWKHKEQETTRKMHLSNNSPKVIQKHLQNSANPIAGSNSPRHESYITSKLNLPPIIMPIRRDESTSSLSGQSDVSSPRIGHSFKISHNEVGIPLVNSNGHIESLSKKDSKDLRPLSMVLEKVETSEHEHAVKREKSIPPAPPVRRFSKQNSVPPESADTLGDDSDLGQNKRQSTNLEEALNELEAIYKSLRLGEEDLLEKAEKRERLAYPDRLDPKNWNAWVQSRGFESDSSFNYSRSSIDSVDSPFHKNISDVHRPCEPDRVADDMAYRRLNKKDRPTSQEHDVISQAGSFLLVSPTLSPPPFAEAPAIPLVKDEPDVTLDDVVYRNIKHVNNSLKVLDPQPLFGIPLGPITPAPNSDYLHITPKERYKSSFKPRKTPDIVTDDLAFRNLRKDNSKDASLFSPEDTTLLDVPNLKKKRAVRSLSANLLGIIQKESYSMALNNNNSLLKNNNETQSDFDKSRSITDLPDTMVSHRLRDNKENLVDSNRRQYSNVRHRRNLSEDESDYTFRDGKSQFVDGFSLGMNTSTETLTDSRTNLQSHESKTRNQKHNWLNVNLEKKNLPPTGNVRLSVTPERNQIRNVGVKDSVSPPQSTHGSLSHSPSPRASAARETIQDKEGSRQYSPSVISLDNINVSTVSQTESDLLAILAKEARATSEQLGKELKQLNDEKTIGKKINRIEHAGSDQSKSSLSIGKVVHHKPVKLSAFCITEDKTLETKKTISNENASGETSKSMTDLLKELTRSLDNDFGAGKKETARNTADSVFHIDEKHRTKNTTDSEFHDDEKHRTKNIEELSEDSNSESMNAICQSASSLTALSNSPLRGLSPLRRSRENVSTQSSTKSLDKTEHRTDSDGKKSEERSETSHVISSKPDCSLKENVLPKLEMSTVVEHDVTNDDSAITITGSTHCPEITDHECDAEKTQLEDETRQPLESTSAKSTNQIKVSETVVSSEGVQDKEIPSDVEEHSEQGASPEPDRPLDCSSFADEGIKMSNRTGFSDVSTLLLVFTYCMACAHQLAGLDNLIILGIFLAMASVLLFLIC